MVHDVRIAVAGEGLRICPHMSPFASICPRLSQFGPAVNNGPGGPHLKTLQILCFWRLTHGFLLYVMIFKYDLPIYDSAKQYNRQKKHPSGWTDVSFRWLQTGSPARAQRRRVLRGEDEQRNKRALPERRSEGYGACEDEDALVGLMTRRLQEIETHPENNEKPRPANDGSRILGKGTAF